MTASSLLTNGVGGLGVSSSSATSAAPPIDGLVAATGTIAFGTGVTGDTVDRWSVKGDGSINLGPGNAAVDVVVARTAAMSANGITKGLAVTTGQGFVAGGSNSRYVGVGTNLLGAGDGVVGLLSQGGGQTLIIANEGGDGISMRTGFGTQFTIDSSGNTALGSAAIATSATNGFLYLVSCAGTPTGAPTAKTGRVPVVVDTTASKLWAYIGGAWKSVTLT